MASKATFVSDVSKWIEKAGGNADAVARETATVLAQRIVERTPVDTGFARASWWAALNRNPSDANNAPQDRHSGASYDPTRGMAAASVIFAQGVAGDVFGFYNNAAYIQALEYGHSKQAPAGMVRVTAAEAAGVARSLAAKVSKR